MRFEEPRPWRDVTNTTSEQIKVGTAHARSAYCRIWGYGSHLVYASAMQPPRQYNHLGNTAFSIMRPRRQCRHLHNATTTAMQPPRQYGHLSNTAYSVMRPPQQFRYLDNAATSAVQQPRQYSHLGNIATSAIRPSRQHSHLGNIATSAIRSHQQYCLLGNITTSAIRLPRQYSHLGNQYGHFGYAASSAIQPPRQYGHLEVCTVFFNSKVPLIWSNRYLCHFFSLLWTSPQNGLHRSVIYEPTLKNIAQTLRNTDRCNDIHLARWARLRGNHYPFSLFTRVSDRRDYLRVDHNRGN